MPLALSAVLVAFKDVVVVIGGKTPPVCNASMCWAWATHATHGHGPPNFLASIERNLSAGPNFMPSEFTR